MSLGYETPLLDVPTPHWNTQPMDYAEKERSFTELVASGVLTMADRHPGLVTLMCDLDFATLLEDDTQPDQPRPGFVEATQQTRSVLGERVEIGMLSSRRVETLTPDIFDGIPGVNEDFLYSSGTREIEDQELRDLLYSDDTERKLELVKDIIDPLVIEATLAGRLDINQWFDPKLIILQELAAQHPDRSFVYIDDLLCAAVIRSDHPQILGVCVNNEQQNDLAGIGLQKLNTALAPPVTA